MRTFLLALVLLALPIAVAKAQPDPVGRLDSLFELRSFIPVSPDPRRSPETVVVAGYAEPLDGGGGVFVWDASSSAPPDDGIIIQPVQVVGSGRWIRRREDPHSVSVLWYGAKDDGSEPGNTATAIDTAVRAIASGHGSTLYFPRGTYAVDRSIDIVNQDLRIQGDGPDATTIRTADAFADHVLLRVRPTNVEAKPPGAIHHLHVEGLELVGENAMTSLRLEGRINQRSKLSHLFLRGAGEKQLEVDGEMIGASMDNISIEGGRYGLYAWSYQLNAAWIARLRITETTEAALYLRNDGRGQNDITLYDPTLEGNAGRAIDVSGGITLRIFGGYIGGNNRDESVATAERGAIELGAFPGRTVFSKLDLFGTRIGPPGVRDSSAPRIRGVRSLSVVALHGVLWAPCSKIRIDDLAGTGSQVWGTMLQSGNPSVTGLDRAQFWPDRPVVCD